MSFCPSNDIHSIYLDNELPQNYKAEYEAHLASCSACRKKLGQLKRISDLLRQNSLDLQPDADYSEESFNRLQIKMTYRKNAEKSAKKLKFDFKYALGAVAAVAVAIFIPARTVRLQKNQNSNSYFVNSIAQSASAIPSNSISQSALNGGFSPYAAKNINAENFAFDSGRIALISGNIYGTAFASDSRKNPRSFAQNIENSVVLKPKFEESAISISITIPSVGQIPAAPAAIENPEPLGVKLGKFQ